MATVYKCPYIDDERCPRKAVESLHYYMDDIHSAGPIFHYGCNLPGALIRDDGYPLCRIDVDMLAGNRADIMKNVIKILSDSKINSIDELEKQEEQINIKEKNK